MSPAALTPAWLLSSRPYGDSSLLLEAFTRDHGRIGLIARGARGPKSRLRGLLQLFSPLLLSWGGRGELGTLNAAEAQGLPLRLSGERVFFGWYLNELLMQLLQRNDAHPVLFEVYANLVPELEASEHDAETALRLFEKYLLAEIGYGLLLPDDLDAQAHYRYDWETGPQPARDGYPGASLIALRDDQLTPGAVMTDARRLLRGAVHRQLGGRELETARLLRSVRAFATGD